MTSRAIHAPVVGGSGAIVVHRALEASLPGYRVEALSPYWGLMPPALALRRRQVAAITHTLPELGPWAAHPGSRLIVTFHNYYLDGEALAASSFAQRAFYLNVMAPAVRASLRRAKWMTAVSHFTADLVRRNHTPGERLVVIRNGVDTELFSPGERANDGPVKILFAGNPIRRKGSEHLAALANALPDGVAMQVTSGLRGSTAAESSSRRKPGPSLESIPSEGRDTKVLLDSGSRSRASGMTREKRSDPAGTATRRGDDQGISRVETIPSRDHADMPAVYRGADILFFPTRREGFGLVVAEAMACGLPIVATNCSSMPELVEHGKGGFLFEMDNRAQMLDYLLRLARDPGMRAEMGAFNREKILAEFPLEKMLAGYRELFAA